MCRQYLLIIREDKEAHPLPGLLLEQSVLHDFLVFLLYQALVVPV